MPGYSWHSLGLYLLISAGAFIVSFSTRLRRYDQDSAAYIFMRYARVGGMITGVGALLASIHLLAILLGYIDW